MQSFRLFMVQRTVHCTVQYALEPKCAFGKREYYTIQTDIVFLLMDVEKKKLFTNICSFCINDSSLTNKSSQFMRAK